MLLLGSVFWGEGLGLGEMGLGLGEVGLGLVEEGLELGLSEGMGREVGFESAGVEEEPRTLPWPLNFPDDEEENWLFTFFMNPLTLSFMSPMAETKILCGIQ